MYNPEKPYTKEILRLIRRTHDTPYVSVKDGLVMKKFSYSELHHSDGVGTKGIYHWKQRSFHEFVLDALAMNLNDLAFCRARPYAVIDHLLIPEDDHRAIVEIISHLSDECLKRNISITGGETAIHDNLRGMDMGMTMLGFVKNPKPNRLLSGDVLIGLGSSGLQSNGFTKVRELLGERLRPEFIVPASIYSETILDLDERYDIHGMMHITGGAYTKLKPLLSSSDAMITNKHLLEPHSIFFEIYKQGVSDEDMYKTFNCGVGFVLGVGKDDAPRLVAEINDSGKGFKADVIGELVPGNGRVVVQSKFSDKRIIY